MKLTTGCRGRRLEDARLKTEDRKRTARPPSVLRPPSSVFCMAFFVLCTLVLFSGCDKRAVEQAQQEAREAKATVQQLKHNLALAEKEIVNAKAELNVVKQNRDELQEQIKEAAEERDQALELAQKAQEAALARSGGQTSTTAALQQQITELNALVAEQEKLIEQLKKGEAAEPVPLPDEPLPTEPNEG